MFTGVAQLGENGDLKALIKTGHPTVIVKKLSVELNCSRYPDFSIDHVSSSSVRLLLSSVPCEMLLRRIINLKKEYIFSFYSSFPISTCFH